MKLFKKFHLKLVFSLLFLLPNYLFAIGSYAEGWVNAKIIQFESRGIIFESYEGVMEIPSFSSDEKCEEEKDLCYSRTKITKSFSVRPDKADIINLLSKSINQEVLLNYKIHMISAISLSSDTEILEAKVVSGDLPSGLEEKKVVKKSGSKRNFSVKGKVLQLDYQGWMVGTYEGLYLDEKRGKVHPFSVTDENMAKHAWITMKSNRPYFMGISVAYVDGFRKSDYDLFEINYNEPAGGVPQTIEKN
ncbi:MAG: hypothetical protein KDK36_19230 [Leptospiraceae bacterium]|nr:hypothetical protein [Leptospiraceae bacterium]